MAHDILKGSVEAQTGRTSLLIIGILIGGVLVACSYVADWVFAAQSVTEGGKTYNFYSDSLALLGALLLGIPIIVHAGQGLLHGETNMDELVALAVVAAIAAINYKAAGAVAFFLLLANLIETRTALGARASIEGLVRLAPKKAHRIKPDGGEELIDPRSLVAGNTVRVRPGDNIPADGVVMTGSSSVNQANVTGESMPVDKSTGDEVFSGTNNLTGSIDVQVTRAGEDTTLGKVQKLILQAEKTRIPIMRMIDRYAGWYTPTILMLAGAVLFFTRDQGGMERAVTMLVVACPCALILAVPTAMVAALSCAARLGILVKDVSTIEAAKNITAFVFDKTGTLTTGELSMSQMGPFENTDAVDLLATAASAEFLSKHPVARAVVAKAQEAKVALTAPSTFEEISGQGVRAQVNGLTVLVGRGSWISQQGIDVSVMQKSAYPEPEGLSTLYVVRDGQLLGWIGLEDRTRIEARAAMEEFRQLGIEHLVMVTGAQLPSHSARRARAKWASDCVLSKRSRSPRAVDSPARTAAIAFRYAPTASAHRRSPAASSASQTRSCTFDQLTGAYRPTNVSQLPRVSLSNSCRAASTCATPTAVPAASYCRSASPASSAALSKSPAANATCASPCRFVPALHSS